MAKVKNAITKSVSNNGLGVYYDSYALCLKRNRLNISVPTYIWHGTLDKTVPIKYIDYFKNNYNVKKIHEIESGHMLYLVYWESIINEISK